MLWSSSLGRNGISESTHSSEQQAEASCRSLINIPHQRGSSPCTAVRDDVAPGAAAEPERVPERHSRGQGGDNFRVCGYKRRSKRGSVSLTGVRQWWWQHAFGVIYSPFPNLD